MHRHPPPPHLLRSLLRAHRVDRRRSSSHHHHHHYQTPSPLPTTTTTTSTTTTIDTTTKSSGPMALQVKGYKALAVPLSPDAAAPFTAFIYVRQHSSKGCVILGPDRQYQVSVARSQNLTPPHCSAYIHFHPPNTAAAIPCHTAGRRRGCRRAGRFSWPMYPCAWGWTRQRTSGRPLDGGCWIRMGGHHSGGGGGGWMDGWTRMRSSPIGPIYCTRADKPSPCARSDPTPATGRWRTCG
jgi:hypothetical protein